MVRVPLDLTRPRIAAALAAVGIAATVTGMFLPWLRSGSVLRDSFQVIGVIKTLGFLRGEPLDVLLTAWFWIIPAATLGVVAYIARLHRISATICLALAIITGTVSGGATVEGGGAGSPISIASTGPTVTLIGSLVALIGAAGIFAGARKIAGGQP